MAVTVKIPTQLRAATGGEAELEVDGLDRRRGARRRLRRRTATCASGSPRTATCAASSTSTSRGEDIRFQQGLETAINDGDEVTILPAVAGG